jgi:hypothetical protein
MEPTCAWCTAPFSPRSDGGKPQKYCSAACRQQRDAAQVRDRRAGRVQAKVCPECGAEFSQGLLGAPKMYCSSQCKARVNNRRGNRALLPAKTGYDKVCAHCGKAFVAKRAHRMYCYDSWCAQSAYQLRRAAGDGLRQTPHEVVCGECGTVFIGKHPSARWCSTTCATRHWGRVKSRRRKPRITALPYTDRQIYIRDKWRCHICGKRISQNTKWPDPLSPSIDHLVPLSLGGADEPSNVAAAHLSCNRAKGVSATGEQLRLE